MRLPIVLNWLEQHRPDVMCLQETKVPDDELSAARPFASRVIVTFRGHQGLYASPPFAGRAGVRVTVSAKAPTPRTTASC